MMREYGLFCYCQQNLESVMQQSMQEDFSDCQHYILILKGPRSSMYAQSSKIYFYGVGSLFCTLPYVKDERVLIACHKSLTRRLYPC